MLLIAAIYCGYYFFPNASVNGHTNRWEYIFIGSLQLANGTLGMAYGVTTSAFLISIGISPVASSAIVHVSEVFNAGASGIIHYRIGNVNKKLFRKLLVPGIIGSVLGASLLYALKEHTGTLRIVVSGYTFLLGLVIIYKAVAKINTRKKIKVIFPVGLFSGFLDAMGGGGWGTIVSATLIAGGRNALYSVGSVSLSKTFIAMASAVYLHYCNGLVTVEHYFMAYSWWPGCSTHWAIPGETHPYKGYHDFSCPGNYNHQPEADFLLVLLN